MSSLISLGSFNSSNGKTAGLGFSSGLDSNAIISQILSARTASVKTVEDKITLNGKKSTAVGELSTLLNTLKTTSDFLRGQTSVGSEDSDFFKHTTATLSSSSSTAASNYISVTSQAGATVNAYKITDVVTAKAHALRKDGFASDSVSVVGGGLDFQAGTFTLRGTSITIAEGDTLKNIKSKINALSDSSGVVADIIKVGDGDFSLVLKAVETGVSNGITEFSAGNIQIGAASVAFDEQQEVSDASFKLDGVAITRPTNVISDAISDVTFTLNADTGVEDPTLTVNISKDNELIKNGVSNFITAYNNLKLFISQQSEVDDTGAFVETAVLGGSSLLRDVALSVDSQFSSFVSGIATGKAKSLADIGITTTIYPGDDTTPKTNGILTMDGAKFDAAIAADFNAFSKVFASKFIADSAAIGSYKTSNKATLATYKLDIDTSREVGNQVRVLDSVTSAFLFNADYNNGLITGQAGTTLDGEQLIYTGDGTDLISVTSTHGIADKAFNALSSLLDTDNGLIATTIQGYVDQDETLQENIDKENTAIESERKILIAKFTLLESIVSKANSILSFLEAQKNSDNSN